MTEEGDGGRGGGGTMTEQGNDDMWMITEQDDYDRTGS